MLQVGSACAGAEQCEFFEIEDTTASVAALVRRKGVADAIRQLGYSSTAAYVADVQRYVEPVYMLSKFCLTPPGDTPKRRGFFDAIMMGYGVQLTCACWTSCACRLTQACKLGDARACAREAAWLHFADDVSDCSYIDNFDLNFAVQQSKLAYCAKCTGER